MMKPVSWWATVTRAAFALLVSHTQWQPAEAIRDHSQGHALDSASSATCMAPCGSTSFQDQKYGMYTIGNGNKVKYEPKPTECLSACEEQDVGKSCGSGYTKVAKALKDGAEAETKMCCKIEMCTWSPAKEEWHQRAAGEDFLLPLQDMTHATDVGGMSCLCCEHKVEGWGHDVSQFCKRAYEASTGNRVAHWSASILTLGKTAKNWKITCHAYCKKFPTHRFAKKAFSSHSWAESLCKDSKDGAEPCQALKAQCLHPIRGAVVRTRCPLTCGLCPLFPRAPEPWRPRDQSPEVGEGEDDAIFDGVWHTSHGVRVSVGGGRASFADGSSAALTHVAKGKVSITMDGVEYTAHAVGGRLSWSDGDVWSRSREAGLQLYVALRTQPARLGPEPDAEALAEQPVTTGTVIAALEARPIAPDGVSAVRFERGGRDLWVSTKSHGTPLLHALVVGI